MASPRGPSKTFLALSVSGDVAGLTTWYARSGRQAYMPKSPPTKPASAAQVAQRALFRAALDAWLLLTQPQRAAYERASLELHIIMTGHNLFMRGHLRDDWTDVDRAAELTGEELVHP